MCTYCIQITALNALLSTSAKDEKVINFLLERLHPSNPEEVRALAAEALGILSPYEATFPKESDGMSKLDACLNAKVCSFIVLGKACKFCKLHLKC